VYAADGTRLTGPNPQAAVVEAQAYRKRSVNLAGAEFGTPEPLQAMSTTFSNRRPGVVGTHYRWPATETMTFLAARGITTIRLPFRWERMQPTVNGALESAEVARLLATIDAAAAAGIDVVVDLHNYGAYWASDPYGTGWRKPLSVTGWLRTEHLADLWRRLSEVLSGRPGVIAYDLMNEPVAMPGGATTWEIASQLVVSVIRARGDSTRIMVEGYGWSGPASFVSQHPAGPWIVDPLDRTFYEAHHYFDCDGSGRYTASYDATVACAVAQGY
jgi:aryl-phospho-beta-D-glucosidase BglC (GH1 family)